MDERRVRVNKNHVEFNRTDLRITNRKLDELEAKLKGAQLSREPMVIISWDYFSSMVKKTQDISSRVRQMLYTV